MGQQTVVIPQGLSETAVVTLNGLTDNASWRVYYVCDWDSREFCRQFLKFGYHAAGATMDWRMANALPIMPGTGSVSNIDLEIIEGIEVSGTMNMPAGTAPADFDFNIFIQSEDITSYSENTDFTIAGNSNSSTFRVTAPNDNTLNYNLRYQCPGPGYCTDNYVTNGFYDSDSINNVTEMSAEADDLAGNANHTNLHMTFLTGSSISGTINMPVGQNANGDISVIMQAADVSNGNLPALTTVTIADNTSSIPYQINVANDSDADWRVTYRCNDLLTPVSCANFFERGFYDSDDLVDMTSDNVNDVNDLAGGTDHSNIDLTLIPGATVSGRISLDGSLVAPPEGLELSVSVQNFGGGGVNSTGFFVIPANDNFVDYTIPIPAVPTNTWLVSYFCRLETTQEICTEFTSTAYYDLEGTGTTTTDIGEADTLTGMNSYSGIDMTVFAIEEENQICFPVGEGIVCI